MIGDVLELKKYYYCGDETLVPIVKHLVSDSSTHMIVRVMQKRGWQARIGKCVGFQSDKWDLASTCKKLHPFNCPVSP